MGPGFGYDGGSGIRPASPTPLRCWRRCREVVPEPTDRRPRPLQRSTRRAPPIDNSSARSLATTYGRLDECAAPRTVVQVPRLRPGGRRGRKAPRHRDPCGVAATSEHPDHTLVKVGICSQYKAISGRGGGPTDSGSQSSAATNCSASTYTRGARVRASCGIGSKKPLRLSAAGESSWIGSVNGPGALPQQSYRAYTSVGFEMAPGSKWMAPTARRKGLPPHVIGTISGWSHRGAALGVHLFVAGS